MKIIKISLDNKIEEDIISEVKNVLDAGGIVVHPTDTCYGLAADIVNKKAVDSVYRFKVRPREKPLSVIVSGKDMFKKYGFWTPLIDRFLEEDKNKMYSFVVRKTDKVPEFFNGGIENIAIQMAKKSFSKEMLKSFQKPLTATSANVSGFPSVYSIDDLLDQIKDKRFLPDLIIDAGTLPFNAPSTIVKIKDNDDFDILRS